MYYAHLEMVADSLRLEAIFVWFVIPPTNSVAGYPLRAFIMDECAPCRHYSVAI